MTEQNKCFFDDDAIWAVFNKLEEISIQIHKMSDNLEILVRNIGEPKLILEKGLVSNSEKI